MTDEALTTDTPENKTATGKPGTEFVNDFGSPEANARFKTIYGHMKEYERAIGTFREHNNKLQERLDRLEYAAQEQANKIEAANLRSHLRAAKEAGNTDAEVDIQSKLVAVQSKKPVMTERLPDVEVPDMAVVTIRQWSNEITEDNEFVRPWAQPSHPKYNIVTAIAKQLIDEYGQDLDKILPMIDERMNVKKPAASPRQSNVLPGGSGRRVSGKI